MVAQDVWLEDRLKGVRNEEDRLNADIRRRGKQGELLRGEREDWKALRPRLWFDVVFVAASLMVIALIAIVVLLTE
jgi:hypothetical protein